MFKRSELIRQALLHHIFWSPASPVIEISRKFGVTPQAVQLHLKALAHKGAIEIVGQRRAAQYRLALQQSARKQFQLGTSVTEDLIWASFVAPRVPATTSEESQILSYGLTEMFNNAIDHSSGKKAAVKVGQSAISAFLQVTDNGEGIFHKIAGALKLSDPRQALLELSKGKFTTDPKRHTGEGIFFCSRMFDRFQIRSGDLLFHHSSQSDDWLMDVQDKEFRGTSITMELLLPSKMTMREVFSRFSSGQDDYRFSKTHVPLRLATFGDESLLSRSSAKRVLARVDRFDEVLLDFADIPSIGPAFADEIFRVFANEHPKVELISVNATVQVTQMIRRAEAAKNESSRPESR